MAKLAKDQRVLTDAEWDQLIRGLIRTVAQLATRNRGTLTKVAQATNLSKASIANMRKTGKASVVSFIRVAAYFAGLGDSEAKELLENPGSILKNLEPASEIESLFNEVRRVYADNELGAWLKLLKSKHQVESDLGISVKAAVKKRPKRSAP